MHPIVYSGTLQHKAELQFSHIRCKWINVIVSFENVEYDHAFTTK